MHTKPVRCEFGKSMLCLKKSEEKKSDNKTVFALTRRSRRLSVWQSTPVVADHLLSDTVIYYCIHSWKITSTVKSIYKKVTQQPPSLQPLHTGVFII